MNAPQPITIHWIDVNDHLPDDEITVLFADRQDEIYMGFHLANEWVGADGPFPTITHWADLPEPPKP